MARRGRPPTRTDRWYALLGLIRSIEVEIVRERDSQGATSNVADDETPRSLTADRTNYALKTITNNLAAAKRKGLFRGSTSRFTWNTNPRGELTEAGWAALGPVTSDWDETLGPEWRVVRGPEADAALDILVRELHEEAARAARRSKT